MNNYSRTKSRPKSLSSFGPSKKWQILEKIFGLKIAINLYPPFRGAGIKVNYVSPKFNEVEVQLRLNFGNRNYVNTQFGGSLYAMTDPWYMLMLMRQLGSNCIVWDKSATIEFVKPGLGKVTAVFKVTDTDLEAIQELLTHNKKTDYTFNEDIVDEVGQVVARVHKVLYIRKMK